MPRSPHRRLLAWQLARPLASESMALAQHLPDGFDTLGLQIERAALAMMQAIVDGAAVGDDSRKASAFHAARGEATELEASLDAFELLGLGPTDDLRARSAQVGALLTGLVERVEARAAR